MDTDTSHSGLSLPVPDGLDIEDLRLSIPAVGLLDGPQDIVIHGFRISITNAALGEIVESVAAEVTTRSRERLDALLAAMDAHPRLRPVRWYYASLFRVLGVRDELAIDASFISGGVEVRARFAQVESGNLLRQLRDRARNLATITARLHLSAVDGALQVRLELSPDVNGLLVNLVLNGISRPGVTRVDPATVRVDLAAMVESGGAELRPRPHLACAIRSMLITPDMAIVELG